ncbi:MAG: ATP-dependent 6-phosphofructokinase [Longimicrobiales bacterium]|nr:ATP-dependent 6-phosphofructokinase [Longimicrobiales bacterium]
MKRLGLLTSGGDAPGMNPAIRAVVRSADALGVEVVGFADGFAGLMEGRGTVLSVRDVGDILQRGGTVLRTARCPEMRSPSGVARAVASLESHEVEGLVVVGGDGSLKGARALAREGVRVVGVPASIDNDIPGTVMAIGVDTALGTIMEAIDKLRDTASSHQRAFLVETMGRHSGYLASMAGVICGAEVVVVPEVETTLQEIGDAISEAHRRGKQHCIVLVAEGAATNVRELADWLEERALGFESRITTLGHVQRGGGPSPFDRMLASRLGIHATQALTDGATEVMVGYDGRGTTLVPLADVGDSRKSPSREYLEMVRLLSR